VETDNVGFNKVSEVWLHLFFYNPFCQITPHFTSHPYCFFSSFLLSLSFILKMVATVRYAKMLKTASGYNNAKGISAVPCHPLELNQYLYIYNISFS